MSVHITRLFNDGNAFIPDEDPSERLAVACQWCFHGWVLREIFGEECWCLCQECHGTLTRSETDEEMAARLAGDLDECERLQRMEE